MAFPPILYRVQDCEDSSWTLESIENLQREVGVRFPKDYVAFLLQFNGGSCTPALNFDIPFPTDWTPSGFITEFIGHEDGDYSKILERMEEFREYISDPCVPIAHGDFAGFVVLKYAGPGREYDGIWFWDYGARPWHNEQIIYPLADSFMAFLNMLEARETDEEEQESIPIFQAVERGGLTVLERYLSQGGNPNRRNAKGLTLLAAAAVYRWPQIVRLLLEHSADPNARDRQGRTPLHHAATHSLDSVKLLLAAGADARLRDNKGKGVLAQWWDRVDNLLRAHGAVE